MTFSLAQAQLHHINHSRCVLSKEGQGAGLKYLFKWGSCDPGSERGRGHTRGSATGQRAAGGSNKCSRQQVIVTKGSFSDDVTIHLKHLTHLRQPGQLERRHHREALHAHSTRVPKAHRCRTFARSNCFQKLSNHHGPSGKQLGCALSTGTGQIQAEETGFGGFTQILRL